MSNARKTNPVETVGRVSDSVTRQLAGDAENANVGLRDKAANPTYVTHKIGEIGRIVTGKTPRTSDPDNFGEGIPFVTPTDMDSRKIIGVTARRITKKGALTVQNSIIPAGAVMVSCIGSDMGKSAIAGLACATNQQINSIVVDEQFNSEFVYYNLSMRKAELQHLASGGSTMPILNKGHFSEVEISFPPLSEQQEIATFLGALDDRIALLRETNITLEAIAQAMFKSWFVDFDPVRAKQEGRAPEGMSDATAALFPDSFEESAVGLVPRGWKVGILQDCCVQIESGGTPKRTVPEYWTGNISWLTSGEVRNPIVFDTKEKITQLGVKESSAKIWPIGTTVVAMYGATAGEVCLLAEATTANQACCGLIPSPSFRSFLFLCARKERENLASKSSGSAQQNLNKGLVANHQTLIPPKGILAEYESVAGSLLDSWTENERQAQTLATLRDTLLPRLISGKLRLPEADSQIMEAI
jgi:type I restriction enzyme S subunit